MSGYYILAIVFIAVAAGLVATYHLLRLLKKRKGEKEWNNNKWAVSGFSPSEEWLQTLSLKTKRTFFIAIIVLITLSAVMFGLGAGFEEKSQRELVKYQTRYSMAMMLKGGDFYKYSGNQIAKETVDIAEWAARVNWSVERYGKFSPYYSLTRRVRLTIGGAEQW